MTLIPRLGYQKVFHLEGYCLCKSREETEVQHTLENTDLNWVGFAWFCVLRFSESQDRMEVDKPESPGRNISGETLSVRHLRVPHSPALGPTLLPMPVGTTRDPPAGNMAALSTSDRH